jgi:hypothetical protein
MGEWVLLWMILQSELGHEDYHPPPIYFHDRAACESVAGELAESADKGFTTGGKCYPTRTPQERGQLNHLC